MNFRLRRRICRKQRDNRFILPHCCDQISTLTVSYFACNEFHLLEVGREIFPVLAHGTTSISVSRLQVWHQFRQSKEIIKEKNFSCCLNRAHQESKQQNSLNLFVSTVCTVLAQVDLEARNIIRVSICE